MPLSITWLAGLNGHPVGINVQYIQSERVATSLPAKLLPAKFVLGHRKSTHFWQKKFSPFEFELNLALSNVEQWCKMQQLEDFIPDIIGPY